MAHHVSDVVGRLLESHAFDELRSYSGNLSCVVLATSNGWVPSSDDAGVARLVDILKQYLTNTGHPENSSFLLRYALTVPGTQRGVVPPLMALEENRGGFSTRRQREAEGQVRRLREALAIGAFFFSISDDDAQQAIRDLLSYCDRFPKVCDAELLKEFRQLRGEQAERLESEAIRCLEVKDKPIVDIGIQILRNMARFRDTGLTEPTCGALIARNIFCPAHLYLGASESVAAQLASLIDKGPKDLTLNRLLLALAWTRSELAFRAFRSWVQHPPRWVESLNLPIEEFLPSAGWCLDEEGNRRDLISLNCFRLSAQTDSTVANVICRESLSDNCPSCGGAKALLFDFSKVSEDFFNGTFAEAPKRIVCCLRCSCYAAVYTRYLHDGESVWLSPTEVAEPSLGENSNLEVCYRKVETLPIPPFAFADPCSLDDDATTLGGIPTWVQDAEFPRCIDCGRFMTFLAQHDNGPLGEEGVYYTFFCATCRVAAVTYQQT